jgi:hypothetical protein
MEPKDLERTIETGVKLTRAAVGLGVSLALLPVRLVLRAISPPPEDQRWEPIADEVPDEAPPEPAETPEPPAPDAPAGDELTGADAARLRETRREEETTPDSPGPEIHVEEPWEGYDEMNVAEIRRRLRGANPTVVAMVRLYEETHRNRKGVLDATASHEG